MALKHRVWTCFGFLLPMLNKSLNLKFSHFFWSDHSNVFLKLSFPSLPDRGPGVLKRNTSLLKDKTLAREVRDFWL